MPDGLPYGLLNQRSPEYRGDLWPEIDDLYTGGYAISANAARYMHQLPGETEPRYRDRLKSAAYLPYMGQIVDYFASAVFAQELTITEAADADNVRTTGGTVDARFYNAFANDADLRGTTLARMLRCALTTALLKRRAIVAVDFPTADQAVQIVSRADEEAFGLDRAFAYEVPVEQVLDWEHDDFGGFSWAILRREIMRRESPSDARGMCVIEFKVWRRDHATGAVTWDLFRTEPAPLDKPRKPEDIVPVVASDQPTSFRRIPLVELALPDGLWIGNKIGPLSREHFQRRSSLISAQNKSMCAVPVLKRGPEISGIGEAMPSETQQNPHRGHNPIGKFEAMGWVSIGAGDDLSFVEPTGAAYEIVDRQLSALKDEMFRVVYQMAASVDNTASSVGRSGASKMQDRSAEVIVLGALGTFVRDFAKRIYGVIAESRDESVVWTAHGLDDFDEDDRTTLLAEAVQVDAVNIPSQTFRRLYKTDIALQLVRNAPPETQETIRDEIEAGIAQADAQKQALADAAIEAAKNPPPPPVAPTPQSAQPAPPEA